MGEFTPMTEEEANAPLPETTDLSNMSDEDLDAALEQVQDSDEDVKIEGNILGAEPPAEEEPAPVVEEPTEVELKPEEEPEAPEEPVAAKPEEEEKVEEPNGATDLDEVRSLIELTELRNKKSETELERWRLLADKNAGKVAHLEQLMKARELPSRGEPGDYSREPLDDLPGADDQRAGVVPPELRQELDEIRNERVQRELVQETSEFRNRHREFFEQLKDQDEEAQKKFAQDFNAELTQRTDEYRDALTGSDAKLARVSARTAYDSALIEARIKLTERSIEASRSSREKRQEQLIAEKRASSPTTGQSAATSPEASDDKPLHQLDDKDLNAMLRRMRF